MLGLNELGSLIAGREKQGSRLVPLPFLAMIVCVCVYIYINVFVYLFMYNELLSVLSTRVRPMQPGFTTGLGKSWG